MPRTTEQIAAATKVPHAYLAKVMQSLNRAGLVVSQRGLKGGISLIKAPAEVTLLDIVAAVDPIKRIETCPLGFSDHGSELCPLHDCMDRALASMEAAFRAATLADVSRNAPARATGCPFPQSQPLSIAPLTRDGAFASSSDGQADGQMDGHADGSVDGRADGHADGQKTSSTP